MGFEQHEFSPGEKIDAYKVRRPLGMGAAGTVYEVEHGTFGDPRGGAFYRGFRS